MLLAIVAQRRTVTNIAIAAAGPRAARGARQAADGEGPATGRAAAPAHAHPPSGQPRTGLGGAGRRQAALRQLGARRRALQRRDLVLPPSPHARAPALVPAARRV